MSIGKPQVYSGFSKPPSERRWARGNREKYPCIYRFFNE
ncbi:hypothetical protein LEP1GSC050_3327 [Leptospira broomii serovar Hurstbridge str. 5399]|uniref:Uncharacterized protein n=1 Tax=Leptospira broomii serovar Hurstbridge str. 5399 TaxID=1049789 RepID=T0GCC4_9LEPT|nr:hypothetical protein LEP1GSC050_3327 [Leptospira broomii serovar Hurstbridge str. 5399]